MEEGEREREGGGGGGERGRREREEEGGRGDSNFLRQLCTCDDREVVLFPSCVV